MNYKLCLTSVVLLSSVAFATEASAAGSYTVKSGDTLFAIAKTYNLSVAELKSINHLTTNNIFVSQNLVTSKGVTNTVSNTASVTNVSQNVKVVNTALLNVRAGGGVSYKIIGSVIKDTKISVISTSNGWSKINYNNGYGFVSSSYLSDVKTTTSVANSNSNVSSSKTTSTSNNTNSVTQQTYTVKSGDSLYKIATANSISVDELKKLNKLTSNTIYVGQKLIVKEGSKVSTQSTSNPTSLVTKPVTTTTTASVQQTYIVKSGDSLFKIATANSMSVDALKKLNNLSSNTIYVGQKLILKEGIVPTGTASSNGYVASYGLFIQPTEGILTSPFGYRIHPITGKYSLHTGVDIAKNGLVNVNAAADGTVIHSGVTNGYGQYVVISHTIKGKEYATLYAHVRENSRVVAVGDKVKAGQKIALMGTTGDSTGQHLHFEIHEGTYKADHTNVVDPLTYIKLK